MAKKKSKGKKAYSRAHHKSSEKNFMKHKGRYSSKHPGCKFCQMVKDKNNIIFENPYVIIVLGRPHHKGHLVILTKVHEEHLMLLHEKTLDNFFESAVKACKALYKAIKFDRINIEYLDNWDDHIHWNIYPRFKTDKDWGQPPYLPKKKERFKEQYMSWREVEVFRKEMKKFAETTMRKIRK